MDVATLLIPTVLVITFGILMFVDLHMSDTPDD